MKLISAKAECLRCNQKWTAKNAMAVAAQHHERTGHLVDVILTYRCGGAGTRRQNDARLPFEDKR